MRKRIIVLAALALAGCSDTAPTDPGAVYRPQFSQSSHVSEFFAFLSPVPPGSQTPTGVFHPYADPRLEICQVVSADQCTYVTHATLSDGGAGIDPLSVSTGQYQTNWTNLNGLPRGTYRLTVEAKPLNSSSAPEHLGTVEVELTATGGSGLQVGGNTLPIKFTILVGAFCEFDGCEEFAVDNTTGGQFILDENGTVGDFGIQFDPGFLCGPNQTNCADGSIVVTIERYSGPERCIPVTYDAIQIESCITIRAQPFGVKVSGVTIGMCIEPFGDEYANTGHLRVLKVKEDEAGTIVPGDITDLNAQVSSSFFFECDEEFVPSVNIGSTDAPASRLSRLAHAAADVLRPIARLLTPSPLHARFGRGPVIASLEDFSRIGPVIPVRAEFDQDNGVGFPGTLLTGNEAPRVRVLATTAPGGTYATTGDVGVGDVRVVFTPEVDPAETVYTDNDGYALASWTIGSVADNPHALVAEVFYPDVSGLNPADMPGDDFPNFLTPWATHTFTAIAQEFNVYFLSPLGTSSGGQPNVTTVSPSVRVCGPLAEGATNAAGQTCAASLTQWLTAPELTRKGDAWTTAWKTTKETINDSLYRIDVVVNGYSTGGFLVRRGGGGGSDPAGTYQFQQGSNLPLKFTLER